jgi:hypothetical protein
MRFVAPIILYASAAFVFWYNGRGGDDVLIFPFITAIWPAAAGNPQKLSQGTIALISGVATLLLVKDLILSLRRKPNQD